uniref:RIP metalloprotease RseP n=1 Tax=Pararhizobium sp. IMCC3301 TaxID=3067904 RepID=UPI0027413B47|nr:RIP metalloprotease RseP [Pararhizobium sp. IMCC3301]
MDFLTSLPGLGSGFLGYALPALFVFTVVVFFHELGHYWVGRLCNVGIDAFSIGFGGEMVGYTDKHGTRWKLCWIPLGGYVKFRGDENAASVPDNTALDAMADEERRLTLAGKPVAQRAAVVAAGPLASFLLSVVIFAGMFVFLGKPIIPPVVSEVVEGSAAADAGLQVEDRILAVDGVAVESFTDLQRIVTANADQELTFLLARNGEDVTVVAIPRRQELTDRFGNTQRVGVLGIRQSAQREDIVVKQFNPVTGLIEGVKETSFIVTRTLGYLWGIVTGRESADQLGGPIRVVNISSQVAAISFFALLNLTAVLSASIGLINLFPIPMLDGGHLAFYAIEAIRGKPLSNRAQEYGFRAGLALILLLFLFVNWNDINFLMGS